MPGGTTSSPVDRMPTTGRAQTLTAGDARGREQAQVLGAQRAPGRREQRSRRRVLVGAHHPVAGRDGAHHLDRARHRLLGVLDHHDRVGPRRQRAAGRHGHRRAGDHVDRRAPGPCDGPDDVEVAREPVRHPVGVGGPHREPVDGGPGEPGQRGRRRDRLGGTRRSASARATVSTAVRRAGRKPRSACATVSVVKNSWPGMRSRPQPRGWGAPPSRRARLPAR